ncbi:MAG: hypothetical protein GC208_09665 [Alphaproteobacteria bacterium]|nr:hypothetical protein [Alphaproteobacteria bacterium]
MQIDTIPGATVMLGAPEGWDPRVDGVECNVLPAIYDGQRFVSQWQPTPDEVAAIFAGAPIHLHVYGEGHPPVALSVGPVPGRERRSTPAAEEG